MHTAQPQAVRTSKRMRARICLAGALAAAALVVPAPSLLAGTHLFGFHPATTLAADDGARSVETGDFNGDTHADLVIANEAGGVLGQGSVQIRLGTGTGTFSDPVDIYTGGGPRSLAVRDVNADLKLDIAVANTGTGGINYPARQTATALFTFG